MKTRKKPIVEAAVKRSDAEVCVVLLVKPSLVRRVLAQASAHTAPVCAAGFQSVVVIPQLWSGALFQVTSVTAAV